MNQKGFVNIALIVLVVVLAGVAGYFVLNNWSVEPTHCFSTGNCRENISHS